MYALTINFRFLFAGFAFLLGSAGLAQAQPIAKTRPLPAPAVTTKAAPTATKKVDAGVPITQTKSDPRQPELKNDSSRPFQTAAQKTSVKITTLQAAYAAENSRVIRVQGTLTHVSTIAGAPAQNRRWIIEYTWGQAWIHLASGQVSINANQQVAVEGVHDLGKKDRHFKAPFLDKFEEINLRRPKKFRLRVSSQLPGVQVSAKPFAANDNDLKECQLGNLAVRYRCPGWEVSSNMEFATVNAAATARANLGLLGFEVSNQPIDRWRTKDGKYYVPYRCQEWQERSGLAASEAALLHQWLQGLYGVQAVIVKR